MSNRLSTLDAMRGIAALSVGFYHLSGFEQRLSSQIAVNDELRAQLHELASGVLRTPAAIPN